MPENCTAHVRMIRGGHVVLQIRGFGQEGDRPLLGELTGSAREAIWITAALIHWTKVCNGQAT